MVFPFTQVYAHTIQGAEGVVLGAMVTGSALCSIVLAIPLGRLADRIGRKKVLYITIPLFWLSNLLLVWGSSQSILIVAGGLQGFYFIGASVIAAIERELVPPNTWAAGSVSTASSRWSWGPVWPGGGVYLGPDRPQYIFLIFVVVDLAIGCPS
jgi:MFS family permease